MPRYSRDPYWLTARRPGICAGPRCTDPIKTGDRIFYYPIGKQTFVGSCAESAARDFASAASDEEGYG